MGDGIWLWEGKGEEGCGRDDGEGKRGMGRSLVGLVREGLCVCLLVVPSDSYRFIIFSDGVD